MTCYAKNGKECRLPFQYKGVWYNKCSSSGPNHDGWWCATSRKADGTYYDWDNCKKMSGCTKTIWIMALLFKCIIEISRHEETTLIEYSDESDGKVLISDCNIIVTYD